LAEAAAQEERVPGATAAGAAAMQEVSASSFHQAPSTMCLPRLAVMAPWGNHLHWGRPSVAPAAEAAVARVAAAFSCLDLLPEQSLGSLQAAREEEAAEAAIPF
jgi:hypothetical protein